MTANKDSDNCPLPTIILLLFLVLPIAAIIVVSFGNFNGYSMVPGFTLANYITVFTSKVTLATYLNTFKFAAVVWLICLPISYPVAYFLSFHVKSSKWQTILFLICTVPFLTSNIMRMISWILFLRRFGLLNQALMGLHLTDKPIEMFLFSDFSVILAMVHLYSVFMVAPIFNRCGTIALWCLRLKMPVLHRFKFRNKLLCRCLL